MSRQTVEETNQRFGPVEHIAGCSAWNGVKEFEQCLICYAVGLSPSATAVAPLDNVYKKGKEVTAGEQLQLERGVRTCERNSPADTKVSEGGEEEGAPGAGAQISLWTMVQTMVKQLFPSSPYRSTVEQRSTSSP